MDRRKLLQAHYNFPDWLKPKLSFIFSEGENREAFMSRIGEIFPTVDPRYALIDKAYDTAKKEFDKLKRDNGQRYFEHLRAVALILVVYLRIRDADLIAAALLHDLVEDIDGWSVERVSRQFNPRVGAFVYWVTKPQLGGRYKTNEDVDRKHHRMLTSAPREAILLKMADRLHNLITMWKQDKLRMRRKVSETRDFILPLAEAHQILIHEIEDVLRVIERRRII